MEPRHERLHRLYPVAVDVQYKILSRGLEIVGKGKTAWISSKQLVFITNDQIRHHERIEVSLTWPAVLDDGVRLKLVIQGRVSERDGDRITVEILKYEFHTSAGSADSQAKMRRLTDQFGALKGMRR